MTMSELLSRFTVDSSFPEKLAHQVPADDLEQAKLHFAGAP